MTHAGSSCSGEFTSPRGGVKPPLRQTEILPSVQVDRVRFPNRSVRRGGGKSVKNQTLHAQTPKHRDTHLTLTLRKSTSQPFNYEGFPSGDWEPHLITGVTALQTDRLRLGFRQSFHSAGQSPQPNTSCRDERRLAMRQALLAPHTGAQKQRGTKIFTWALADFLLEVIP